MSRYIDADALLDDVFERYCKDCDKRKGIKNGEYRIIYEVGEAPCRACDVDDMKCELDDAPTVDAVPVVHGHWEEKEVFYDDNGNGVIAEWQSCRCSECKKYDTSPYLYYFKEPKYCSECGAKMDEVTE